MFFALRLPRSHCAAGVAILFLTLSIGVAQAQCGSAGGEAGGFALVVQALQARPRLVYVARQDILWTTPMLTGNGGMAQIVADITRAGRRASITYRYPPEAAGRVMLDDGVHSSLYDPVQRALMVGQSSADDQRAISPKTLGLLRRNYRCLRLSREELNGQVCDVVSVCPRAGNGPSKRLWIDATHHAILRTEEYDAQGFRRYVSFYETIRFPRCLPPDALELPRQAFGAATRRVSVPTRQFASAPQAFSAAGLTGRVPAWCPGGFALMHCSVIRPAFGKKAVLLHYSDGLKSLVVLEEPCGGTHPAAADLNRALARYGQQAWVQQDGRLRIVVRGDLSLPDAWGAEMTQALSRQADVVLSRGLAHDFGVASARLGALLRRAGWGYDQISALLLWEQRHPRLRAQIGSRAGRGDAWPRVAAAFGAEAASLTNRSRAWVASTLVSSR